MDFNKLTISSGIRLRKDKDGTHFLNMQTHSSGQSALRAQGRIAAKAGEDESRTKDAEHATIKETIRERIPKTEFIIKIA